METLNEKKMTDSEIVTDLENYIKNGYSSTPAEKWLEYILNLQSENEGLKAKNKLDQMDIEELHKDRERRVEEVYADFMHDYKIMREELNDCQNELIKECREHEEFAKKAKAEIERLTKKADGYLVLNQTVQTLNEKILAENAELQKQVEGLKTKNKSLGLKALTLSSENKMLVEICNDCDTVKQAVKDTAKEIWDIVMSDECSVENTFDDTKFTQIVKERYGVEVEW